MKHPGQNTLTGVAVQLKELEKLKLGEQKG